MDAEIFKGVKIITTVGTVVFDGEHFRNEEGVVIEPLADDIIEVVVLPPTEVVLPPTGAMLPESAIEPFSEKEKEAFAKKLGISKETFDKILSS